MTGWVNLLAAAIIAIVSGTGGWTTLQFVLNRRNRVAEAAKPKVQEPPFSVVGLELRGGERFLSIAAAGASSLPDVRLLREGESVGPWQLQTIEAHAAVFREDGQTLRVAVP